MPSYETENKPMRNKQTRNFVTGDFKPKYFTVRVLAPKRQQGRFTIDAVVATKRKPHLPPLPPKKK